MSSVSVNSEGSFVCDGLWPGEWVLSGHPFAARALDGGEANVTARKGDVEVPYAVSLSPR